MARLGLLIPEFPTQTHIAMWRLGQAMRRAGVGVEMLSTRRPADEAAVHPALVEEAARTFYCWPAPAWGVLAEMVRSIGRLPAALGYALGLPEGGARERVRTAALIMAALALKRRARRRGLEHVFVHSCASGAHLAALCRILGGPAYSLRLGGDIDVYGLNQRAKMRRATVVVGAADVNRRQAIERGGVEPSRAIWSWLGVETGRYMPARAGRADGSLRLITVARLNLAKGHRFALEAVAAARARGVDVRYRLVGDGPGRGAIQEQVAALGLGGCVELAGSLDQDGVRTALQDSDVFVLPTSGPGEGSPVAVLEAMSAGLAIVATDVGGLRDMVGPAEGLLVPPGDASAIEAAIVALAGDRERRAAMGAASRARALREFDVEAVAERLLGRFFPGRDGGERPGPGGLEAVAAELPVGAGA